jgi:hypothetical protein
MAKTKVTGEYLKDSVVRFTAKAGENITKGNAVYISGISGELPVVSLADADDTAKMPAFGLAEATVSTNDELEVTSFGTLANLDTSSYTLGDILYVGTTAGALTNDPAGLEATKLQNIGIVQRVHASNGSIKVGGAGRTNAVPNLDDGDIFIGDSNNKAVSSALSTEIESYLDGGTSTPTFASATVSTASSGATAGAGGDELVIENSSTAGMSILSGTANDGNILFGDSGNSAIGYMQYKHSVNALAFGANGSEVARFDSSGNFGIGTDSPLAIGGHTGVLTLYGSNATALVLQNSTSSSRIAQLGSDLAFFNNTYETERMRLTSTGLDAAASLKIESSTGGELILSSSDTAQAVDQFISGLAFKTGDESAPSSVPHYAGIKSIAGDVYGNQTLEFYSGRDRYEAGTNPNMVILGTTTGTDGNVGIGTDSPAAKLTVYDATANGLIKLISGDSETNISFEDNSTTDSVAVGCVGDDLKLRTDEGNITFFTGSAGTASERMRINSSGNVGIGESSPEKPLHVSISNTGYTSVTGQTVALFERNGDCHVTIRSNAANHGSIKFADDGNSRGEIRYVHGSGTDEMRFYTAGSERMRIDSSGDVSIGSTSAGDYRLKVRAINSTEGSSGKNAIFETLGGAGNVYIFNATGTGVSTSSAAMWVQKNSSTSRSINAAGTVNASGADYAEYMKKSSSCGTIAKGDVCGVDSSGKLTDVYADAVSFVVKSTNPSYVGGDTWGADNLNLSEEELETERQKYDRIAFSGQVPVNITGSFNVGDYVYPQANGSAIECVAKSSPTFEEYQKCVGKVWAIEDDGRPRIAVKIG